jgi:hypothetical protein
MKRGIRKSNFSKTIPPHVMDLIIVLKYILPLIHYSILRKISSE